MKKTIVRNLFLAGSACVCVVIGLLLIGIAGGMVSKQDSQQMAKRWSEEKDVSQVSCFFSSNANISTDSIELFRHELDNALVEASIVSQSPNANARLWADAYSADGKITLKSERGTLQADAIGIGGDFFRFHPVKLLYGSYISEDDLNQDRCLIDEDAAWQLFGSNNVAGMLVEIQGIPHVIAGVVEREDSRLAKAAGLDATLVYVSHSTLEQYGTINGINHYEIVMPDPVKGYASKYVQEHIKVDEKEVEFVENTTRYQLLQRFKLMLAFGTRSMNGKAIIYPYWENIARGVEDIVAMLTLWALILFVYPVVLLVITLRRAWKCKNWTVGSVFHRIRDLWEDWLERSRAKRMRKKEYKDKFDEQEELL